MKLKVRAHTSYLGHTGYAAHARGFFRSLAKHCDLRVRNFNWDSAQNLRQYVEPVDLEILDQITLSVGQDQRADFPIKEVNEFLDFGFKNHPGEFEQDVDIVLIEPSHYYFFEDYTAKTKIAYTVWESTKVSDLFLQIIQKFDAVWVVSKWHKQCLIEQGVSADKIWVVPEGVDADFSSDNIYPKVDEYDDNRFKFLFFGRWDYRKSVPEIINAFLTEFSENEPVDLVLSADNPFSIDGMNSTEERLESLGFVDPRIKVKHFPSRQDYLSYLHNGHAMITCARSEGWNIPLCEALSAGIPVTYSNWGAQLEFCEGIGCPVNIVSEVPTSDGQGRTFENGYHVPGSYCLPDYEDLKFVLRRIYTNYFEEKNKAIQYSKIVRQNFNWNRIGEIGFDAIKESVDFNKKIMVLFSEQDNLMSKLSSCSISKIDTLLLSNDTNSLDVNFFLYNSKSKTKSENLEIAISFCKNLGYKHLLIDIYDQTCQFDLQRSNSDILSQIKQKTESLESVQVFVSFVDGASVNIRGYRRSKYRVDFIDLDKNQNLYQVILETNNWAAPNRKYFTNWYIVVTEVETDKVIFEHKYNAENQRILVCLESSSLGDSIAWLPAIDEFRKKHNCQVFVSTFLNRLYQKEYPDLNFVEPGSVVQNLYALYRIGWYYNGDQIDTNRNPIDPKTRPMQATSFDILGVEHKQVRTKITIPDEPNRFEQPYVCIGVHATTQAKYWNFPRGWDYLIEWFDSQGYKVVLISKEQNGYMGNHISHPKLIDKSGNLPLEDRIVDLKHAAMFIGVGSGLSWLAWATGTPVVLISGFSHPDTEFLGDKVVRIFNSNVCNSCFNRHRLDGGDWMWCPDKKGTEEHFECTKKITPQRVISEVNTFLKYLQPNEA